MFNQFTQLKKWYTENNNNNNKKTNLFIRTYECACIITHFLMALALLFSYLLRQALWVMVACLQEQLNLYK